MRHSAFYHVMETADGEKAKNHYCFCFEPWILVSVFESCLDILLTISRASAATLVRQRYIKNFVAKTNLPQEVAFPSLWSTVELGLTIISGSLPVLRPLLSRVFKTIFASPSKEEAGPWKPDSTGQCHEDLEHQTINPSLDNITVATNTEYADSYLSNGGVKISTSVIEDISQGHRSRGRSV